MSAENFHPTNEERRLKLIMQLFIHLQGILDWQKKSLIRMLLYIPVCSVKA
ncbi:hypothetical protein [Salipaludibacillus neizhouensis]|uniref:hypothetical protein n=1 Tax=Salipaludibacillus neizhouensis TaxID=885475 RepID=UPI0016015409|nr:hypothetical protein [Salipaludibacillus neizhouensis]